jgi:hypothetical protein
MTKKYRYKILLLCILFSLPSRFPGLLAQSSFVDDSMNEDYGLSLPGTIYQEGMLDSENDPYLFPEWKTGSVTLINDYKAEQIELLYNSNKDLLIFKNPGLKSAVVLDKNMVSSFTIQSGESGETRHFEKVNFQALFINESQGRYSEVLEKGAYSIYVLRIKLKKSIAQSGPINGKQYLYEIRDQYFLKSPEGSITRFTPTNAAILNLFAKHRKEIHDFIRKEGLSARHDKDLTKIIHYCNKLVEE